MYRRMCTQCTLRHWTIFLYIDIQKRTQTAESAKFIFNILIVCISDEVHLNSHKIKETFNYIRYSHQINS